MSRTRKRPPYLPGRYYHFYNRGAHRLAIFREDENFLFGLRQMKSYCRELELTPIAYCLMPNHYHLFIRQDGEEPAGLLPQRIFNSYSKAYNTRYGHAGTLFESRFKAAPVEKENYLLHLCRYIHANPVKDGLVERPEQWPYSNYLEWLGRRQGTLVDRAFVAEFFPRPELYEEFVWDFLRNRQLPEGLDYLD
ncbi:MAG: transposase [Chloroflexi bacterium]|nr:transposase [Chloroflexota bacterium]MCI0728059.1 transposase [Chloroflexota bacterium]